MPRSTLMTQQTHQAAGVFSGQRWQSHICPIVRDLIHVLQ